MDGWASTVTAIPAGHKVVLQPPSALAKYVAPAVRLLNVNVDPVPMEFPFPQPPAYHTHEAPLPKLPPLTDRVELPPIHTDSGDADTDEAAMETGFTVIAKLGEMIPLPQAFVP
jgi:hypothetical protein